MTINNQERINKIIPFLEIFKQPGYSFGEWSKSDGDTFTVPYFTFSTEVSQFLNELYENDWIKPFDWSGWQREAQRYVEDLSLVETADVETIEKLFTTHVRKDRFCEGHLVEMFRNGHIVVVLERLEVLGR